MPSSFIARVSDQGGPTADLELRGLVEVAQFEQVGGTVWFATKIPGNDLAINPSSRVLIIGPARSGQPINAVFAVVKERRESLPDDAYAKELYEGHDDLKAWWKLESPVAVSFQSLDDIPGTHSTSGKTARESFSGQASFAYWDLPATLPEGATPTSSASQTPPGIERDASMTSTGTSGHGDCFYGVDFSGGQETNGSNPKIWIAKWDTATNDLTLECGGDGPGFRRTDLPGKIVNGHGWWAIDFPFCIPSPIAELMGYRNNTQWWSACATALTNGLTATAFRDQIRENVVNSGQPWSQRRAIDVEHGTTWFPLFEQLYRQTIHGAGEVLAQLPEKATVAVLPWDANAVGDGKTSFVSEGFPGVTIRSCLGLPATGYKGNTAAHFAGRVSILGRLASQSVGLPITHDVFLRAAEDTEGDAVDALVLVVAARLARQFGTSQWQQQLVRLNQRGLLVEGWFPSCSRVL